MFKNQIVITSAQIKGLTQLLDSFFSGSNFFEYADFHVNVRPSGVVEMWLEEEGCDWQSGHTYLAGYVYPAGKVVQV